MPPPTAHNFPTTRLPDDLFLAHNTECDICKVTGATDTNDRFLNQDTEGDICAGQGAPDEDLCKAVVKIDACNHVFHQFCLTTWVRAQLITTGMGTCPMCRRSLVEDAEQMRSRHALRRYTFVLNRTRADAAGMTANSERLQATLDQLHADTADMTANSEQLRDTLEALRAENGALPQIATDEGQSQATAATLRGRTFTAHSINRESRGLDDEQRAASIAALRTHLAEPQSGSLDMEQMRNRLTELEAEQVGLRRAMSNLPGMSGRRISRARAGGILSYFRPIPSHDQQDSNTGA